MSFFVYILASKRNATLYIGMTDDLLKRVWHHRNGVIEGFTKKYGVNNLVWFETTKPASRHFCASVSSKNGIGRGKWR